MPIQKSSLVKVFEMNEPFQDLKEKENKLE